MRLTLPPRVTRILLVILVLMSFAYQATAAYRAGLGLNFSKSTIVPWVSLTPQSSWRYPWVYATATFAEQNLFTLAIAGATLLFGCRYLERAWGEQELAKFVALLVLVPNVVAAALYMIAYWLTGSKTLLNTSIQGSIAVQAGFIVTFKQLVPEHTVSLFKGAVRVRVKHFPAVFLLANTISGFVLFTDTAAILSWLGFFTAWIYLRFYQQRPDDLASTSTSADAVTGGGTVVRGDASETFAFAYFWPDRVHAPIAAIGDMIYGALVALGVCTPFSAEEVVGSTQDARLRAAGGLPLTRTAGASAAAAATVNRADDSERRRALALQALNERLAAARAGPPRDPPLTQGASGAATQTSAQNLEGQERVAKVKPEWSHEQP